MNKPFTAEQFTAYDSGYETAESKAKFANHLVRFIESDFKWTLFYDWFYTRLSMTFGHIAEFTRTGFYGVWCSDTESKLAFLRNIRDSRSFGEPTHCMVDVENAIRKWLTESGYLKRYENLLTKEIEAKERAELARLKAKYEAA